MKEKPRAKFRSGLLTLAVGGVCLLASLGVLAAAALSPTDTVRAGNRGDAFARARKLLADGRATAAKNAYKEILEGDPRNAEALRGWAIAARDEGNDAEVIQALERLTAVSPNDLWAHRTLAIAYHRAGRNIEAMSSLQTAMSLAPDEEKGELSKYMTHLGSGRARPEDPMSQFRAEPHSAPAGQFDPFSGVPRPETPDPLKQIRQKNPY